jgi:aryl-alcohol dehydrogenase-like predicted oxidoreductase
LEYRTLGETGMRVSEVSLGTWAFGGEWGTVSDDESHAALNRAIDLGVNFETGLEAAEELKELVPEGYTLAQLALRWILMHQAVSCAIPGAKRPGQAEDNLAAAEMPPLSEETMDRIREIYTRHVRPEVHHRW